MKLNNLKRQVIVNENSMLIRSSNRQLNCVRFGSANDKHEMKKAAVCLELHRMGHQYCTEAIFCDGSGIADILVLDVKGGIVYEILDSESKERFEKKKYPVRETIPIRV